MPAVPTTGKTLLPDAGNLTYNSVSFSCLYKSKLRGVMVQDESLRTTKAIEYTLEVEGYITLRDETSSRSTDEQVLFIRNQLSAQGGFLFYEGNGLGSLNVNTSEKGYRDLAWGPIPKLLELTPLGGGNGVFVRWQVTTTVAQYQNSTLPNSPVMQWNYGMTLVYDEKGYASVSLRGTLEIGMTRRPQTDRFPPRLIGQFRQQYLDLRFDLETYKVVNRSYDFTRDGRKIEWVVDLKELPPMGLPPGATKAGGTYSIRPAKLGTAAGSSILTGLCWGVTMRCTYTIRKDFARREAVLAFFALLWYRMNASRRGYLPEIRDAGNANQQNFRAAVVRILGGVVGAQATVQEIRNGAEQVRQDFNTFRSMAASNGAIQGASHSLAILSDFNMNEGLYEDSDSITLEASWLLLTTMRTLLEASGVWQWERNTVGGRKWAASVGSMMGWRSWEAVNINPNSLVIMDLDGGRVVAPAGAPGG